MFDDAQASPHFDDFAAQDYLVAVLPAPRRPVLAEYGSGLPPSTTSLTGPQGSDGWRREAYGEGEGR